MFYNSLSAAWVVDFLYGLFYGFAFVAAMDLADQKACPAGCEGIGLLSLMMSVMNLSASGADTLGALQSDVYHVSWNMMVIINAATTSVVLAMLPCIPTTIMKSRDNHRPSLGPDFDGIAIAVDGCANSSRLAGPVEKHDPVLQIL